MRTCLCLLVRPGYVLLGHKKTGIGAGNVTGIGGKLEPGEEPRQAAARELAEEAGVRVDADALTYMAQLWFAFPARPAWDMTVSVFTATEWTGEPAESAEIASRWFPVNALPFDQMWDDARHWLPSVLAGQWVTATFSYADDCRTVQWMSGVGPGLRPAPVCGQVQAAKNRATRPDH